MNDLIKKIIKEYELERVEYYANFKTDYTEEIEELEGFLMPRIEFSLIDKFKNLVKLIKKDCFVKLDKEREDLLCLGIKIGMQIHDYIPKN